jgi:hypothetical protein
MMGQKCLLGNTGRGPLLTLYLDTSLLVAALTNETETRLATSQSATG